MSTKYDKVIVVLNILSFVRFVVRTILYFSKLESGFTLKFGVKTVNLT